MHHGPAMSLDAPERTAAISCAHLLNPTTQNALGLLFYTRENSYVL